MLSSVVGQTARCFVACYLALLGFAVSAFASDALALQSRVVDLFSEKSDAIVRVKAAFATRVEESADKVEFRFGTGFFISREGYLLVSASRALGASKIWVEHKGDVFSASPIGHDPLTNVSILKIDSLPETFEIIQVDPHLDQSSFAIGSFVVAITAPLDFGPTPVVGTYAGTEKKIGRQAFPAEYIRTSISVDGGQGGCPLFDLNGQFVGMSVSSIPGLAGSFSIPANALKRVCDDLLFSGNVVHGWMGFEVKAKFAQDSDEGVYVADVAEEGPAQVAGLREGDRIIKIGANRIDEVFDVPSAMFFIRPNQFTDLTVDRDGEEVNLSIKALPKPKKEPVITLQASENASDASNKAVKEGDLTSPKEL